MNTLGIIALLGAMIIGAVFVCIKKMRISGIALLTIAIAFLGFQYLKEDRWSRGFEAVPDGSSIEKVVSMMGDPTIIAESTVPPFGYTLAWQDKRVKREAWFVSFFFPQQYALGFDKDGHLIMRYRFSSP